MHSSLDSGLEFLLIDAVSSFGTHTSGMILGFPVELIKEQMSSRDCLRGKKRL